MKRVLRNVLSFILITLATFLPLFLFTYPRTLNERLYGFDFVYYVLGTLTYMIGVCIFFVWLLYENKKIRK